jgi:hypothetical protein
MAPRIACLLLPLLLLGASAAVSATPFQGAGNSFCREFARDLANNPDLELLYFTWAQGFMMRG